MAAGTRDLPKPLSEENGGSLPNCAASTLKSVHEFADQIHLASDLADEAAEMFETSLLRPPSCNCLCWVLHAPVRSWVKKKAREKYEQLLPPWDSDSRAPVQEAMRFVAANLKTGSQRTQ